jgi:mono/diheme cytochrome c family protein
MNKAILIGTVLLLAAAQGCGGDEPASCDVTGVVPLTGDAVSGQTVFNNNCAASNCHGSDGNQTGAGATAMSEGVPGKSKQQLAEIIKCGTGDMTAQAFLSDQEIADAIQYTMDTFGP